MRVAEAGMTGRTTARIGGLMGLLAATPGCDGSLPPDSGISYIYVALPNGTTGQLVGADPVSGRTTALLDFPLAGDDLLGWFMFDGTNAYYSDYVPGSLGVTTTVSSIGSIGLGGGTPATLVTGLDAVHGIAVDADSLYFSDFFVDANFDYATAVSFIGKAPRTGGAFVKLVDNIPGEVEDVAVGGGFVYWANATSSTISRVAVTGGDPTELATTNGTVYHLSADDSGLYWVDEGTTYVDCNFPDGSIQSVPTGSASAVTVVAGVDNPSSAVISAGSLYFTTVGATTCATSNQLTLGGAVMEAPSLGSPVTLAGGLGRPFNLFVAGAVIDYTSSTGVHTAMAAPSP
jgi:hypothetical protein